MNVLLQMSALVVIAGISVWAAREVKQTTLAALSTITEITNTALKAVSPPSDAADPLEVEQPTTAGLPPASEVDWDPTDAAFGLADPEFGGYVPKFGNDPGPIITHPLGIPGLVTPYPTIVGDPEYSGGPT